MESEGLYDMLSICYISKNSFLLSMDETPPSSRSGNLVLGPSPERRRGRIQSSTLLATIGGVAVAFAASLGVNTLQLSQERQEREKVVKELQDESRGEMTKILAQVEEEKKARAELEGSFEGARREGMRYFTERQKEDRILRELIAGLESNLEFSHSQLETLKVQLAALDEDTLSPAEFLEVIKKVRCSLVAVGPIDNPASGFFINNCEFIVTNHHVSNRLVQYGFAKDGQFPVTLYPPTRDGEPFTFYVTLEKVGGKDGPLHDATSHYNSGSDVAVFRVSEKVRVELPKWVRGMEFRDHGKDPIQSGEVAIVVGNPKGFLGSATVGHVSDGERHFDLRRREWGGGPNPLNPVVQVDAEMNSGSSGGMTVDSKGRLMGVSFYGLGAGFQHARHVLNLKATLENFGIPVEISPEEREVLKRWEREWKAIEQREKVQKEEAERKGKEAAAAKAEEDTKRAAEEQKKKDEEAKKKAEEEKRIEEEVRRRLEVEKKKLEEKPKDQPPPT